MRVILNFWMVPEIGRPNIVDSILFIIFHSQIFQEFSCSFVFL